jgi:uncharacterized protein YjbI with pentapeptide repeats
MLPRSADTDARWEASCRYAGLDHDNYVVGWFGSSAEMARLGSAFLIGASLRGADLRGAYLRLARLQGADLSDADLEDAGSLTQAQLVWVRLNGRTKLPVGLTGAENAER